MTLDVQTKRLMGIDISIINQPQLLAAIESLVEDGRPALVNNVNVYACNLAYEQPEFRNVLNQSQVVFCDGFGVKLAGWMTGNRLGQRMTPPDWIDDLFSQCVRKGYRVFFLGDTKRVVELFADKVAGRFPELDIAGVHDGFFDLKSAENVRVLDEINGSGSDIVITGMGMPRQELWAWEAKDRLDKGVIIATGALFRWYTGVERRAPKWVTDCGLEWLARLLAKPRTHFKRYVIGLPLFFWRVFFWHSFKWRVPNHG